MYNQLTLEGNQFEGPDAREIPTLSERSAAQPPTKEQNETATDAVTATTATAPSDLLQPADAAQLRKKQLFLNATDDTAAVATAAYKSLRTKLVHQLGALGVNNFMVAGPSQNVGKTLTAANLALMLAKQQNPRVILADLDLRSPSIHTLFGIKPRCSVYDVATGKKRLSSALVNPGIPGLTILPGCHRHEESSELLLSTQMQSLLRALQSLKNHIVVIDTPPILGCDDVTALAPHVGACLMVVRQNRTQSAELAKSLEQVEGLVPIVGVTVNGSNEMDFGTYYY